MCGRFAITHASDAMARLFEAAPANNLPDIPNYNVCPTTQIHVVFREDNGRRLVPMRWGFVPRWYKTPTDGPLLINARAETIAEKPAFREACRQRRCLIPADGFYEWFRPEGGDKLPWFIQPADEGPMVFAGIWQEWGASEDRISSCAIVTTEATGHMAEIHHRIPVILQAENWAKWLGEEGRGAARLMTAAADETLTFHRVGTAVNSNRAQGPDLIEEID
ncbi:SOS response-associated peptidase [Celeribacter litoreus]|uniref:SOS response-associated peptidase n=1 Tax=Celeribacter litoreus TaxID=2876714 RepID=UPI001CCBFE7E|nr:SOS response-associated peptidase [Celeribacter litoreus]MCA0042877.1 SOS response-associated peptidase [Celeribacter litoreus]